MNSVKTRACSIAILMMVWSIGDAGNEAWASARPHPEHWVATWAAAPQSPDNRAKLPPELAQDFTLRQIVRVSMGGSELRVRLSNSFGTEPLRIASAHIAHARSSGGVTDPASDRPLLFNGRPDVVIPAGATYVSDPVALSTKALASLAISLYLQQAPTQQTAHVASHSTSYYVAGNHVADAVLTNAGQFEHWFQLQGIDVAGEFPARTIVAFGDSITDGSGTTSNANQRWPDILAERLQARPAAQHIAIINEGIGGNRLLHDGVASNGLARFDRDVLAQPGASTVILLEGVNDLGSISRDGPVTAERRTEVVEGVIDAYRQIIIRAHARGVRVVGATILPFGGTRSYRSDADAEIDRQKVNAWILSPGHFDAVIDFDKAVHDPAHPNQLLPTFDSGDHLHPSPAGYRAMAEAIPIDDVIR